MRGRTVVVVEDERVIAGALAARLRAEGFRDLALLSSDAVGPLLRLPDTVAGCPLAGVRAGLSQRAVLSVNVGRLRARHALAGGRGSC